MVEVTMRVNEAARDEPFLLWDTLWDQDVGYADWKIEDDPSVVGFGGLAAGRALETAIILSLFTWKRATSYELAAYGYTDPKGWWGDAVDLEPDNAETELGSKLWLLLRGTLSAKTAQTAADFANEALAPLVKQGAVARFDVTANADVTNSRLELYVKAYSETGEKVYDQRFSRLWSGYPDTF